MGGNQSESSVSAAGGIRAISGKNGGEESTTEHTERPKAVTEYTENSGGVWPWGSVSSVCREAASVCSVVKRRGGSYH